MSYILEALKKAQAERQLGELPTIHAPQLQAGAASHAGLLRKPLWLALGATALLALGGSAALLWRTAPSATTASQAGTATPVALAPAPVLSAPLQAPPAKPVVPAAPPPMPVPAVAVVSAAMPPAPPPASVAPVAPPVEPPALAVGDETALNLRDLPEPIQRQIPPLVLGGYMYSKNPADRLLLIDKVLRHEGEEVAPGVVLEKLLPKAAQFTFKGYRYRITY